MLAGQKSITSTLIRIPNRASGSAAYVTQLEAIARDSQGACDWLNAVVNDAVADVRKSIGRPRLHAATARYAVALLSELLEDFYRYQSTELRFAAFEDARDEDFKIAIKAMGLIADVCQRASLERV